MGLRVCVVFSLSLDWYATFCRLAGVDSTDDVTFKGKIRRIDSVDVWDLLMGVNSTQPRPYTPVTEVSIVDASDSAHWWKLITLAGQSGYYTTNATQIHGNDMSNTVCLKAKQADPQQPGRTDPIVNGMAQLKSTDNSCPVCNATMPCLYDILAVRPPPVPPPNRFEPNAGVKHAGTSP